MDLSLPNNPGEDHAIMGAHGFAEPGEPVLGACNDRPSGRAAEAERDKNICTLGPGRGSTAVGISMLPMELLIFGDPKAGSAADESISVVGDRSPT